MHGSMTARVVIYLLIIFIWTPVFGNDEFPEQEEIDEILQAKASPEGVIFVIQEYDEDALEWVAPRLHKYVHQLRKQYPEKPIALMSHGEELIGLSIDKALLYASTHKLLRKLVNDQSLLLHICGAAATMVGLDDSDFPDFVDVVPFGPSQVEDYLALGYTLIDLELTW